MSTHILNLDLELSQIELSLIEAILMSTHILKSKLCVLIRIASMRRFNEYTKHTFIWKKIEKIPSYAS